MTIKVFDNLIQFAVVHFLNLYNTVAFDMILSPCWIQRIVPRLAEMPAENSKLCFVRVNKLSGLLEVLNVIFHIPTVGYGYMCPVLVFPGHFCMFSQQ